jgi:HK97 family phage major capsid protein
MPEVQPPTLSEEQRGALLSEIRSIVGEEAERIVGEAMSKKVTNQLGDLAGGGEQRSAKFAGTYPVGSLAVALAASSPGRRRTPTGFDGEAKHSAGAAKFAEKFYGAGSPVAKALNSSEWSDAGIFIEGDVRQEVTDLLLPEVAVMAMGPVVFPMPSGTGEAPRVTADVTAYYQGEGQEPTPSKPGTGSRSLKAKELVCEVPISNKLLRRGGPEASSFVQRLMTRRMGIRKDQALLKGNGTAFTPRGLYHWAANKTPATSGTPDFAEVLADLGAMLTRARSANVAAGSRFAWAFSARTEGFLKYNVVTSLGMPYFLQEMMTGKLLGFPFFVTNNVEDNLGSGADESWILCAAMDNVIYGDSMSLSMGFSTEASYTENGEQRNAFTRDETLMVVREEHDLTVEHQEAVEVLTEVTWGVAA